MGGGLSIDHEEDLRTEELEELEELTGFTRSTLMKLFRRFKKLDQSGTGTLSREELLNVPDLAMNPMVERILDMFEFGSEDQGMNFREFVQQIAVFNEQSTRDEQLRVAFNAFDMDGDDFISYEELAQVFKIMVGTNMTQDKLLEMAKHTIEQFDHDRDGKLSVEEFCKAMKMTNSDILTIVPNVNVDV